MAVRAGRPRRLIRSLSFHLKFQERIVDASAPACLIACPHPPPPHRHPVSSSPSSHLPLQIDADLEPGRLHVTIASSAFPQRPLPIDASPGLGLGLLGSSIPFLRPRVLARNTRSFPSSHSSVPAAFLQGLQTVYVDEDPLDSAPLGAAARQKPHPPGSGRKMIFTSRPGPSISALPAAATADSARRRQGPWSRVASPGGPPRRHRRR